MERGKEGFKKGVQSRKGLVSFVSHLFSIYKQWRTKAVFLIQLGMLDLISLGIINSINGRVGSGEASRKKTAT